MPFQLKTPLFLSISLATILSLGYFLFIHQPKVDYNLEKLWLDHTGVSVEGLKTVSNLKNLKYLNLYKTNMENKEIAAINFSKEMQVISPTPKDTALIASDSVLISAIKK
jgi:hypothetical protein